MTWLVHVCCFTSGSLTFTPCFFSFCEKEEKCMNERKGILCKSCHNLVFPRSWKSGFLTMSLIHVDASHRGSVTELQQFHSHSRIYSVVSSIVIFSGELNNQCTM